MSLEERRAVRDSADLNAADSLMQSTNRKDYSQIVVRSPQPLADFAVAGAGQSWLIPGPSVVGTEINLINAVLLTAVQAVTFYGIGLISVPVGISRLRFLKGAGDVRAVMSTEELETRLEPSGYFAQQQVYAPQDTLTVPVLPKAVFANSTIVLMGRFAEPRGNLITAPLAL